ncbi:MAG: NAD-dependent alcohol dehydrogenase, partial [Anaerolineae bacterium]|nr:NAD-dependent alcohol dehydrogenase [Anaerolineae bacterium]
RDLSKGIDFATSIRQLGVERAAFDEALPKLVSNALADNQLFFNQRYADADELERLFQYAYEGRSIDF